jgi:hypothetical protein
MGTTSGIFASQQQDKQDATAPAEKKSKFETIVLLTPVVFTVIATALAGQSMHEMTNAQYHRSVAGQNQSKVGDQWAYFQAKKIRATEMEMTTDRIPVSFKPAKLDPYHLEVCGERLQAALVEAHNRARKLVEANKDQDPRLQEAMTRLLGLVEAKDKTPEDVQQQLIAILKKEESKLQKKDGTGEQSVFVFLDFNPKHMPQAESVAAKSQEMQEAVDDPDIKKVAEAIARRDPEHEIATLGKHIKVSRLKMAIDAAEAQAQAFSDNCKSYSKVLDGVNGLISRQVQIAAECHLAALVAAASKPQQTEAKEAASQFVEADATVQVAAQQLNDLFKSAYHDFNQRRYSLEAANNQKTAELYEVQVHHSSMLSDDHLERSKMFSWAMMAMQAGVAVASLALAAQRKSMLWLLAAILGFSALGYSAWVMVGRP